jgi:BirA family transcriptional regulator, biotin operon repressor / biotin---[acetyl-CoA-carboxylase] ligase
MMYQSNLEQTLSGLPLAEIRFYSSLDSTNDFAAGWARDGARDASLVVADRQQKGRGRLGRTWVTVPGEALAFSLVLLPTPQEQAHAETIISRFSGLGAVAVCQALRNHYQLPGRIKWPNDVLVAGKKICGVLVEAQWMGSRPTALILGIGVNIGTRAVPPQNALRFPATSLQAESGLTLARWLVLRQILAEILHWRTVLVEPIFLRFWQENLAYLGEWVQIRMITQTGEPGALLAQGQLLGLNPDGAVRLRTRAGEEISYRSGEIQLRPVDSFPK